jgi:hypothetical protein
MKTTKAKQVKKGPLVVPMKDASKRKTMPKSKPRSLGCGTHQRPQDAPHVV